MGPLKALCALALVSTAPASASQVEHWRPLIREASLRFAMPESWIARVMQAESGGRTMLGGRPITSRAGAMGLMQVMPDTYREMARAHGLGPDPHDPRDNILAGTAYLRAMYDRFGYPGLFAAYNAGPGRYEAHLRRARPLPGETVAYLAQVAAATVTAARSPARPVGASHASQALRDRLFFALQSVSAARSISAPTPPAGVFVIRRADDPGGR